jgi:hypothetical protein
VLALLLLKLCLQEQHRHSNRQQGMIAEDHCNACKTALDMYTTASFACRNSTGTPDGAQHETALHDAVVKGASQLQLHTEEHP